MMRINEKPGEAKKSYLEFRDPDVHDILRWLVVGMWIIVILLLVLLRAGLFDESVHPSARLDGLGIALLFLLLCERALSWYRAKPER